MTEKEFYEKSMKIQTDLSEEASEACSLCRKCEIAHLAWGKDPNSFTACNEFDRALEALECYCASNKQIRSELEAAYAKLERLIADDIKDSKAQNPEAEKEIASLKAQLAKLEAAEAPKKSKMAAWKKATVPMMVGSLVVAFIVNTVNKITEGSIPSLSLVSGAFILLFWVALLMRVVLFKDRLNPEIAALRTQISRLEAAGTQANEQKHRPATSKMQVYGVLINITAGNAAANYFKR